MARRTSTKRTTIPPLNELVGSAEAIAWLHITRRHLYRLSADGLLPVYKVGARNLYHLADLEILVRPQDRRSA